MHVLITQVMKTRTIPGKGLMGVAVARGAMGAMEFRLSDAEVAEIGAA
jgi:hypothetical protein